MPTQTYIPLANVTLGSTSASVTFSSISQSYRDLVLVAQLNATVTTSYLQSRVNNDTGSKYNEIVALGTGSSVGSYSYSNQTAMYFYYPGYIGTANNTFVVANYFDYSATDKHKTIITRGNAATASGVDMVAHRWASTSAITSLSLFPDSGSFAAGSTFALYGIAA